MSLSAYKQKRSFDKTPEPKGKEKSSKGLLKFVVQKHDASHLHYDFRLEMAGVLKSWAVPKGPSLNPADKRLAMMVEDHPYDYRDFEGIIPEGNYGGGTVIVWDEGTYEPIGSEGLSRKEQEKMLLKQLYAGNLKFIIHGKKLKGEYALFLMKSRGERSWILMKKNDEFASEENVLLQNRSVKSRKTLAQVAHAHGTEVKHPEDDVKATPNVKVKTGGRKTARTSAKGTSKSLSRKAPSKKKAKPIKNLLRDTSKLKKKDFLQKELVPMMATLIDEPFDNENWLFEIKWDGYRAVAHCDGNEVELVSRSLSAFTETYYPITDALKAENFKAVFDGEIVAVDEKGLAVFQSLQNWRNTPVQLRYYIFDILWLDGFDLTSLPLLKRKEILKKLLPANDQWIKYSDHVIGKGKEFFEAAVSQGLEGIMAKKADSSYLINTRSSDWVKIKTHKRQEVVIAGYTEPRKSRQFFGALLLGLYDGDELVYIGHTGSGFTVKSLSDIFSKLQPLVTDKCPFEKCPKGNTPVTWVKPRLVCEIKFTEWTKNRIARHPIFMGLRSDKKAKDITFEKELTMATARKAAGTNARRGTAVKKASKKSAMKKAAARPASKKKSLTETSGPQLDLEESNEQFLTLNGQELKLTNLQKLYWKKEGFTKGDMINYYLKMAPYMLPYMVNRPQSLNRHPDGIDGLNFYQKNQAGKVPAWMQTHKDFSESNNETIEYLVCKDEATLIYMANLGCIEMHPWHSRTQSWEYPDWCLVDLDPDTPNTYDQVMEVAKRVKKVLDSIGAEACLKTSGSTGLHIYIPLGAKYDYDQSKQLAELIVTIVNHELPDITSVERSPAKRKGKIYLDYLQNRQTQTAAAPYSLRPKPGMPVSTPLDWSELKKGLKPTTYHAKNIFERLHTEGDLFKPVLGKGINFEKVLKKLERLIGT